MRLTMHVGLPKTATTYIQHTLSAAKSELARQGVIFPDTSLTHHEIPKLIGQLAAGRRKSEAQADALLAGFAREAEASGCNHVLISSEYLIETTAPAVALLEEKLRQHFPGLREVMVLCYVREPIAFSTSYCQQVVKSAHQRLSEFYANPWPLNLRESLSRYVGRFGRDAVQVRKFHPDSLKDGDILSDFVAALGLNGVQLPQGKSSLNTALSAQAVQIADALAEIRPVSGRERRYRRNYRRALESIQGERFVLPEPVQDRVIAAARDDLAMLKQEFGIELQPLRQPVATVQAMPEATAGSMARLIVEMVEGRPA